MSVHLYTSSHFPLTAYRTYISHLGQDDMALGDRARLDLLDSWGRDLVLLAGYGKDGQAYTVALEVSQATPEEMIGDSALLAKPLVVSGTNSGRSVHQVQRKSPDQHFSLFDDQFIEVGSSGR